MAIKVELLGTYEGYTGDAVKKEVSLPADLDDVKDEMAAEMSENGFTGFRDGEYAPADIELEIYAVYGDFLGILVGDPSDDVEELNDVCEDIERLNKYDREKLAAYLEATSFRPSLEEVSNALDKLDDVEFWEGMSLDEVAEELVNEGCFGEIPERIACYIDYEAIGRDLRLGDGYEEVTNGVVCIR